MHKNEIVETLEGKGDFVKIDYLTRYLRMMPPLEMRKFASLKLAEIYLGKEMYIDAAKMFRNVAMNSLTFRDKQDYYSMETKAHILAGKFDESDKSLKRALAEGNSREKQEIYGKIIAFYMDVAEKLDKRLRREKASKIYEKLYRMRLSDEEKEVIKEKLLELYEKLGKRNELEFLRGQ